MHDTPKHIKRKLRELATAAHEEELRRALLPLADDLDRMRRGELSSHAVSDRMHALHDGEVREMWKMYVLGDPHISVAYAVHTGILAPGSIPADVMPWIEPAIGFYRITAATESHEGADEE